MQIKFFTIPIGDNGALTQDMNGFMRGNKILEVEKQLIANQNGAYWCICISYIEKLYAGSDDKTSTGEKIDYRNVLDAASFKRFSDMREIRKKIAMDEGISAFIVFTDSELAELAKFDQVTEKSMLGIKGIGEKKVSRFLKYFQTKKTQVEAQDTVESLLEDETKG